MSEREPFQEDGRPVWHGRAMASEVTVWVADGSRRAVPTAVRRAFETLAEVERQCTRFDERSALMRLNRSLGQWVELPAYCYRAVSAAHGAWRATGGRFDPRVMRALARLGYGQSLAFEEGPVRCPPPGEPPRPVSAAPFLLRRPRQQAVKLLDGPIDLGGIGKGLGVRWAARHLERVSGNFLVNAGGDCLCRGDGPEGDGWRVGVEDPQGGAHPVAVLAVRDRAVCTSSVRRRSWWAGAAAVHHLIDPRTGEPAAGGLLSVTVVGADPAWSEVWSKALFVEGAGGIAELARARRIAAFWVEEGGGFGWSPAMEPYLLWAAAVPTPAPRRRAAGGMAP